MFYASLTHLLEIAFWAVLFMICGEFTDFGTALYHSAVNYTSLGYGDLIMSPSWRLLGPLETENGALLFAGGRKGKRPESWIPALSITNWLRGADLN